MIFLSSGGPNFRKKRMIFFSFKKGQKNEKKSKNKNYNSNFFFHHTHNNKKIKLISIYFTFFRPPKIIFILFKSLFFYLKVKN